MADRPSSTSALRQSTSRASSAPYCPARPGHGVDLGLVVLAEVGGVGAGDGALLAHPRDGHGGVETPGEGDADALADGQGGEDLGHDARLYRTLHMHTLPACRWAPLFSASLPLVPARCPCPPAVLRVFRRAAVAARARVCPSLSRPGRSRVNGIAHRAVAYQLLVDVPLASSWPPGAGPPAGGGPGSLGASISKSPMHSPALCPAGRLRRCGLCARGSVPGRPGRPRRPLGAAVTVTGAAVALVVARPPSGALPVVAGGCGARRCLRCAPVLVAVPRRLSRRRRRRGPGCVASHQVPRPSWTPSGARSSRTSFRVVTPPTFGQEPSRSRCQRRRGTRSPPPRPTGAAPCRRAAGAAGWSAPTSLLRSAPAWRGPSGRCRAGPSGALSGTASARPFGPRRCRCAGPWPCCRRHVRLCLLGGGAPASLRRPQLGR